MTKDRRLGRGLAALLGTPLEEDGIVEGSSRLAREPVASESKPLGSSAANSSALVRGSTTATIEKSNGHKDAVQPTRQTQPTLSARGGSGVTGAVPLDDSNRQRNSSGPIKAVEASPSAPLNQASATRANAVAAKASSDASAEDFDGASTRSLFELNVADIDNNPFQPRRRFNEQEIASLAESIREHEQLQPILVRRIGKRFQLISGERRLRATIHAGMTTIRAEIREADDRLVAELAIVENLQRKDLDAIEKAMSFRRYIDQHQCTQEDLAKRLKIDRSTIANLMRLLELPEQIQCWVQDNKLTAGHARTLLPLGDEDQQMDFARRIQDEGWTVRDTEFKVNERLAAEDGKLPAASNPGPRKRTTPQLAALEQQLRLSLGAKTEIRQTATGRGKIVISFSGNEEFDRLCALICPQIVHKAA